MQKAVFAVAQGINHEPAFNWWVQNVLKRTDRIIASIRKHQTRHLKKSHKFGIELPKTVKQAYAKDAKIGNNSWQDAISKRFYQMERRQFVQCHLVFDIKWRISDVMLGLWQEVTPLCMPAYY